MVALSAADAFPLRAERVRAAFGDTIFTCQYVPAWLSIRALAREADTFPRRDQFAVLKLQSAGVKDVYIYRWNMPDPVPHALAPRHNVLHASHLFFFFDGTKCVLGPFLLFTEWVLIG